MNGKENLLTITAVRSSSLQRHEHLYPPVEDKLIISDELTEMDARALDLKFRGVRVVLCTLSMLSNATVRQRVIKSKVKMNHLVIDEASQISIFQLMVRPNPLRER